jgi:hypothetical protein
LKDSCLTVLKKILKPYSCTLQQWGGKYYILSKYEADSFYYNYTWALAYVSKVASNDVKAVEDYKLSRNADKSFLPPVKEATIKLLNRNLGENLAADINDYDSGAWDYSNYTGGYDDTGSVMELTAPLAAVQTSNGYITLTSDESIE